ncbi:hypothetical protein EVAR_91184_1 [Eumeta japonica]|uniref:Uncharacterized protein n=1 Tax=Eumeta variegata TaxID=151549 RepID=A0A4C1ZLY9_EUMVA|nr:hypothetical protein EVAR_91184_1 [Eumeta japonica]
MASAPYVALLPTAPAGSLRECAVIETMASAPYVALLSTAPAGSLRECAVIETMASAPVTTDCAGGSPRECAVIETMASAPYVALLSTAPAVVCVNVPSSKPWLQRRGVALTHYYRLRRRVVYVNVADKWSGVLPTAPAGGLRECAVIETMASAPVRSVTTAARRVVYVNVPSSKPWLQRPPYVALLSTAPAGSLRECAVIETMASAPYVALLPTAPAGSLRECAVTSKPWLQRRT